MLSASGFLVLALLGLLVNGTPVKTKIRARGLLGSNFGIPTVNRTFDYVVVGGGNSGLVIASRLSENPNATVAVVEAGSFYEITTGNTSEVPAFEAIFWNGKNIKDSNPLVDWGFLTTPQAGINGQQVHYERGKTLGGCSALNYMAYERTTVGALQRWADTVNDTDYTYEKFAPNYAKSLIFTPPNNSKRAANSTPEYDDSTLGSGKGPLHVGFSNFAQPLSSWMTQGFNAAGVPPIAGFTSGALNGSSWSISTLQPGNGARDSSETSFLRAGIGRQSLTVYVDTLVERILFTGKRATGVLLNSGGAIYQLNAAREVIVSAGAFQSPQLLMVSGIGPPSLLSKFKIPVISGLVGVGQGMNDHIYYGITYRVKVQTASSLLYQGDIYAANAQFINDQNGFLSNTGGDFLAYEKFPSQFYDNFTNATTNALNQYPSDWPDLEYLVIPAYLGTQDFPGQNQPLDGYEYGSIAVSYMKPISRGNISIQSDSMQDKPLINPSWLTSPIDVEQSIAAFKRVRQIFQTKPLTAGLTIGPEYYPGTSSVNTDAQILEQVKKSFNTVFHATSTCKMGPASDPLSVVDTKGRVYGTQGLRIVDASIMPFLPPGLPMGTVYALAEKIVNDIQSGN